MSSDVIVFEEATARTVVETVEAEGVLVIERPGASVLQEEPNGDVIVFPSAANLAVDTIELEADLLLIDEGQAPVVRLQETGQPVVLITSAGLPGTPGGDGPPGPSGGQGPQGPQGLPGDVEVPDLIDLSIVFENGLL